MVTRNDPSFFLTNRTGELHGDLLSFIIPALFMSINVRLSSSFKLYGTNLIFCLIGCAFSLTVITCDIAVVGVSDANPLDVIFFNSIVNFWKKDEQLSICASLATFTFDIKDAHCGIGTSTASTNSGIWVASGVLERYTSAISADSAEQACLINSTD